MSDLPPEILSAREKWKYRGEVRPDFAAEPGPGQESVWDYPRPPAVESDGRRVQVVHGDVVIADTREAKRVSETASPPVFYMPPDDVRFEHLEPSSRRTMCEWKGQARYWSVRVGDSLLRDVAWSYPDPFPGYEVITDHVSFYPARIECRVEGIPVRAQPGRFYGGWVTPEIVGPFKGEPGSAWW